MDAHPRPSTFAVALPDRPGEKTDTPRPLGGRLFSARRDPPGVNRVLALGLVLTLAGLAGYLLGLSVPYWGRAFSVTAMMVGIALVAMRRAFDAPGVDE